MDHVSVTECPLSIEQMTQLVTSPSSGAIATFIGTTRDDFDGKKVVRLEYEAYQPMAEQQLRKICGEVRSKWPAVERMAIAHRTGLVPVAESSVIIAISSPHRRDALEGVQYAIDVLKASVPIWKKEVYEESESKWKENRECPWSAQ
ncbi:Molybdopterin synthase catalytic subunit [Lamellibrachia satsuma]|nr:Molybdopterin synthase catalytic subunit [Lamellibrachia satsuma]